MPLKKVKKALKTFKFWYQVLKEQNLMDDPCHRKEYTGAINNVKKYLKKATN
jgi:hypothetical protein